MREILQSTRVTGTVKAPPSKSYTNRALLLAAIASGSTTVHDPLDCDDARYMLEAIRTIGFEVDGSFQKGITVGERTRMSATEVELYVGNAGTAMRFLTGLLPFVPGRYILRGDERMHQRPIGDLLDALVSLGVEAEYLGEEGFPPLRLRGRIMRGGFEVQVSGETSSQFVSALMMGGATLPGGIRLRVDSLSSRSYVALTRDILEQFGATVTGDDTLISVQAAQLRRSDYTVEGDYSSASYWFAAAAATAGRITVTGLRQASPQGDREFLDILRTMGCSVEWSSEGVSVQGGPLHGGRFDCNTCPDIVPTLAAIAPLAAGPVEIVNVPHLRVKESDRISSVAGELRKLGATVEERDDGMRIEPGWHERPAEIDPHGDHRLAMAFAIAGLARGAVTIASEQVVTKSYPRFWKTLDTLLQSQRPE